MNTIYETIAVLRDRINNLERIEAVARSNGLPIYPTLTSGSVIFAGVGGVLAQDNANFFWDDTNNRLGIGTTAPAGALDVLSASAYNNGHGAFNIAHSSTKRLYMGYDNGLSAGFIQAIDFGTAWRNLLLQPNAGFVGIGLTAPACTVDVLGGTMRFKAGGTYAAPTSGRGLELTEAAGTAYIIHYDRSTPAYHELRVEGNPLILNNGATGKVGIGVTPASSASKVHIQSPDNNTTSILRVASNNETQSADLWYGGVRAGGTNTNQDIAITAKGSGSVLVEATGTGTVQLRQAGTTYWSVSGGDFLPSAAGTYNVGNATVYVNDVSYKTLTDRGCLAFVNTWETLDGNRVSNLEAIKLMRPSATEKTIYGEIKLDYTSVPKHSYKDVPIAEEDIEIDVPDKDGNKLKFKKGEKIGEPGVEMTSIFSMMLGAIREMADTIDTLKVEIDTLKNK